MLTDSVGYKHHSDHDQKRQRKHLYRGVPVDDITDRARRQNHHEQSHRHGGNHYRQMLRHSYRGYDRVEREYNIEEHDLNNRPDKAATCSHDWFFPCLFEFSVDFECALGNQKKAACKKD